jgi:hypothetical protein
VAETQRTITDLYTRLADQATGDISPEDVRDIVETLRVDHVQMYLSSSAVTNVAVAGTFLKVAGTTALTADNRHFSSPVSNRLQYDGAAKRLVYATANISFTSASPNKEMRFRWALGGVTIAASEIRRYGASASVASCSCSVLSEMTTSQYLELFATNVTDTTDLTVTALNIVALGYAHEA